MDLAVSDAGMAAFPTSPHAPAPVLSALPTSASTKPTTAIPQKRLPSLGGVHL